MPTNVTPQYKEAEARFRAATTHEDKIAALEDMLRIIPKHKGTDKLQADLKARIAKLRKQPAGKTGGARVASHMVPKEGAGQIVLVGPPNGGKSALVTRATHATPKVGEYPFTTRESVPGMMPHLDVSIQLIDLPPISREHTEPWVFDCVRRADLVWVVVNHAASLDGFEDTRELLEAKRIQLVPVGRPDPENEDLSLLCKKALIVVTGADQPGSEENLTAFRELLESPDGDGGRLLWPTLAVSSVDGRGLEELAEVSYGTFGVIRVYTKQPGKPADHEKPFTVPRNSTVADLAAVIHKDLSHNFKFARLWGKTVFDGQRVQADHELVDEDIIEIHI
jgi:ribosome-interacting GTPase 1